MRGLNVCRVRRPSAKTRYIEGERHQDALVLPQSSLIWRLLRQADRYSALVALNLPQSSYTGQGQSQRAPAHMNPPQARHSLRSSAVPTMSPQQQLTRSATGAGCAPFTVTLTDILTCMGYLRLDRHGAGWHLEGTGMAHFQAHVSFALGRDRCSHRSAAEADATCQCVNDHERVRKQHSES